MTIAMSMNDMSKRLIEWVQEKVGKFIVVIAFSKILLENEMSSVYLCL